MRATSQGPAEGVRGNRVRARRQDVLSARGRGDATTGAGRVGAEGMHEQGWTHQPPREHNIGTCTKRVTSCHVDRDEPSETDQQEGFFFLFSSSSIYVVRTLNCCRLCCSRVTTEL